MKLSHTLESQQLPAALKKAGLTVTAIKEKEDWRSVTARKE